MARKRGATAAGILLVLALSAPAWTDKDFASVIARRHYWAFQKPVKSAVPDVKSSWVRNPIDAFILEALREKKLAPAQPLDREHLLRRATFDLTGLPPEPGEIDAFLRDKSPDAYEKVVDRLVASPHYGERWALRWLDVVRYADTNGYELDAERPQAWRYRDYVVKAFNTDKPYDRFVKEQIAGDELFPGNQEALIATGFHRAGPIHLVGGNQDEEVNRQEVVTEMSGAIGSVFLGLTVGCARCHNHKFDPILQSDYYRLQAIFAATELKDIEIATANEKAAYYWAKKDYEARLEPVKKAIDDIEKRARGVLHETKLAQLDPKLRAALEIPKDKRDPEQKTLAMNAEEQLEPLWSDVVDALTAEERAKRAELRKKLLEIQMTEPDPQPAAYAVADSEKPAPPTYILKVGDVKHKIGQVEPGVLTVLNTENVEIPQGSSGRRAALANWLASPDHPLTARVMVNRIWQLRMGTGIVATPNDFGVLGQRPTNQKLLDWLAVEFMEHNWSVKTIDRMIVTSSAYQQASAVDGAAQAKIDPDNKLYWRMNRKRLEGELIRDAVLEISGALNPRVGGKPVRVPIEQEVYDVIFTEGERDGLWPVTPSESEQHRRSLYLLNKRTVRLPMMTAFDQPDTMTSCPMRPVSTHALQALSLFNSDFMREESSRLAARLGRECGRDRGFQLRRAYKLALARAPRAVEMKLGGKFLEDGGALADFCLALMNRNEFVYVP
jgi:hypothetical protein